jgi:uncharacterized protein (TIGR02271 family)
MTSPTALPFAPGAIVRAADGEEIGVLDEVRAQGGTSAPELVVRMSGAGSRQLVPLDVVDIAASTIDTVQLTVKVDALAEPGGPLTIAVHEDVLTPVTRDLHLGDVVIHKRVEEEPYEATVDLGRDEVLVEHVPVNREVEAAPEPRYEGDVLIIPLLEEVLVTEKRLVLREEIRITRHRRTEQTHIRDVLRREVVDIQEHSAQGDEEPSPSPG